LQLAILLVVFVFMLGAWSGFWTVKKFVVTKDGSVDISTSIFVSWSIRAFAVALILQVLRFFSAFAFDSSLIITKPFGDEVLILC